MRFSIKLSFVLFVTILLFSFNEGSNFVINPKEPPYHLTQPTTRIALPSILQEVSGLTDIDSQYIACVQDEKGIIFIYDINAQRIAREIVFGEDGDYEGITRVGKTFWILRSDGNLLEVTGSLNGKPKTTLHETMIPATNNEALCYDQVNHRLLIGCKSKPGKGKAFNDIRVIYGFDLNQNKMLANPVYQFSVSETIKLGKDLGIEFPTKIKKKTNQRVTNFKFGISGIGIHPITKDLYVLSAVDYLLLIYDNNGAFKLMKQLSPNTYKQAEGITFLENGDLFISNEGQDKIPMLYYYEYSYHK